MTTSTDETVSGFEAASRLVLDYLHAQMPMGFWSITRVENGRQTYLSLDENTYGLRRGESHPWESSYCIRMVSGAPRIAPRAAEVPEYAAADVNRAIPISAYAGAPIAEPEGGLFGAICGLDTTQRPDLAGFGPILDLLAGLLTVTLAGDRAVQRAERTSTTALTRARTDSLTGIPNRMAWDDVIAGLDRDHEVYADPTVVVVVDLDDLKRVNDGPGGHAAGDRLLCRAADVMRSHIREQDVVARLGGDEFGIVLAGCAAADAPALADRIEQALTRADVSASLGWAPLETTADGKAGRTAVEAADRAMYEVKARRRRDRTPVVDRRRAR